MSKYFKAHTPINKIADDFHEAFAGDTRPWRDCIGHFIDRATWRVAVWANISPRETASAFDRPAVDQLARLNTVAVEVEGLIADKVAELRAGPAPVSWSVIGTQLGMSKQAAQQRYGK